MKNIRRREFIRNSLIGLAGSHLASLAGPFPLFGRPADPSDRITVGLIGLGKQGGGHLRDLLRRPDMQVTALCDVDQLKLEEAQSRAHQIYREKFNNPGYQSVAIYRDFRDLIDRPDIDAVLIATPDHWHALMVDHAAGAGKDIYCEKPLSLTIAEARHMVKTVRRHGRICQTGSQQRSDEKFRFACELVRNGYIGQIQTVHVAIETGFSTFPRPCTLAAEPVPGALDWNLWLGPAPFRPYNHAIAPPIDDESWARWRNYLDYSGGGMTDWGAHHFDIAQWGLGMDESGPLKIAPPSETGGLLTYTYAGGITMTMTDKGNGVTFHGTGGEIFVNRSELRLSPDRLKQVIIKPDEIHLTRSDDHKQNWIDSIKARRLPICDIETGARSVTVCHLGNIAERLQKTLAWDPVQEKFINDPQADRLIHKPMRSPWLLS